MAELLEAAKINLCPQCGDFNDPLSIMSRMFVKCFLRDRFDILNHYSPFRVASGADPIPVPSETPMADIMDAKAKELIAEDKPIVVLWSGGVDSTAIVAAFLRNGVDLQNFKLAYASAAIKEHPRFFKLMQAQGVTLECQENIPKYADSLTNCLTVTGHCADQLFGSASHRHNPDLYNGPWIDGVKWMMEFKGIRLTDRSFDVLLEVYNDYAEKLGLKIEQFCEFAYLFIFAVKWADSAATFRLMCLNSESRKCIVNFFEDYRFQCWSVNYFQGIRERCPIETPENYNTALKEYIFDFDGDVAYRYGKGKVFSRWMTDPGDCHMCDLIRVHDTDGYHAFKDNTSFPWNYQLANKVRQRYLKEEFQE